MTVLEVSLQTKDAFLGLRVMVRSRRQGSVQSSQSRFRSWMIWRLGRIRKMDREGSG